MRALTVAMLALFAGIAGCAIRKNLVTPFVNPVNRPVVDDGSGDVGHGTKYCAPNSDGQFAETAVAMDSGTLQDGSAWAVGGGCVLKPIREVWATFNNLEEVKWEAADRFTYQRTIHPKPGFTHLYEITYFKQTLIGPIEWTMDWYHGFDEGTFEAPLRVNIVYQRVSGTSNIPIWDGGIVLTKVNAAVTSIAIRNHFKARQSISENVDSARVALDEMVGHARNGQPDWLRLNEGFKSNPSQPDPPVSGGQKNAGSFCVKGSDGNYPMQPDVEAEVEEGVSKLKVRACISKSASSLFEAAKDHSAIKWKNSSSVTATFQNQPPLPLQAHVSYASGFLWMKTKWDMTWEYTAPAGISNAYSVTYKIDPPTSDFPVWNGNITITPIEPGASAVEIDNDLLGDDVSKSPEQNKTVTLGLLNDLAAAAK